MSNTDKKQEFQKHIAGLRAVAIALVILAHYSVAGFSGGFIGVDVFFVISGFLITGVLTREYEASRDPLTRTGKISLGNFYLRRVKRLLPAAIVTSLATLAWTYFNFSSFRFSSTLGDFTWAQLFAANINFALQDSNYFLQGSGVSVFRHFWSLSVEEQFYFLWPALLMAAISMQALKFGRRVLTWQSRALLALVVVTVISIASMFVLFEVFPVGSYYLLSSRAWELGIGGIGALLVNHFEIGRRLKNLPNLVVDLSFLGMVASIFLVTDTNFGWTMIVPVLFSAVFICAGGSKSGFASIVLSTAPMQFVGRISYSLYLWHWPVLVFAQQGGYLNDWPSYLIAVALTLALSTISYYFVERPFLGIKFKFDTTKLKPLALEHRARFVSLGLALLLVVAVIPSIAVLPSSESIRSAVGSLLTPKQPTSTTVEPSAEPSPTSTQFSTIETLLEERGALITQSIRASYKGESPSSEIRKNISVAIESPTWTDETGWQCETIVAASDCTIGSKSATREWLVIGDSMAAQYRGALRRIAEKNSDVRVRLIHQAQCPNSITLRGLVSRTNRELTLQGNENCVKTHEYEQGVVRQENFDLILLSDAGGDFPLYLAEASDFAIQMKKHTKNLVVVARNPPYPPLDDCLNREETNLSDCSASSVIQDISDKLVAQAAGAPLLRPQDIFCYLGKCPALIGGLPVSSRGHINADQAYFSGILFGEMIRALAPTAFK